MKEDTLISVNSLLYSSLYGLNVHILLTFTCWSPDLHCADIWKWDLWEVVRSRVWSPPDGISAIRRDTAISLGLIFTRGFPWPLSPLTYGVLPNLPEEQKHGSLLKWTGTHGLLGAHLHPLFLNLHVQSEHSRTGMGAGIVFQRPKVTQSAQHVASSSSKAESFPPSLTSSFSLSPFFPLSFQKCFHPNLRSQWPAWEKSVIFH